jgi:hypothetical protein
MPIGSLIVKIGADISGIQKNSQKAAQALGGIEQGANRMGTALKALAFGFVARELKQMVGSAMDAIDASTKLSKQLGGSIDGLTGLQHAASEAGVSSGNLARASENLNRRLGEAARKGAGPAHEALQRLGLTADELSRMDVDERMAAVSDAMIEAGMSSQQMSDILGMVGVRSGEMVRLLSGGGEAIRAARVEIERLGQSITAVDAAKVEAANDAMARAKTASTALSRQIAVAVSPIITELANRFVDLTTSAGDIGEAVKRIANIIGRGAGFIADAMRGVHIVFKSVELAGWGMATVFTEIFRTAFKAISLFVDTTVTGPINLLIEALNKIPGVDITPVELARDGSFMKALDAAAEASRETTADVAKQLKELATGEWPSAKVRKFFIEVAEEAEKAGQAVAKQREVFIGATADEGKPSEAQQKEIDARQKKFADELAAVLQHTLTKEEIENAAHARRLEVLDTALENEQITVAKHAKTAQILEKKHMAELIKIRKDGMDQSGQIMAQSVSRTSQTLLGMLQSLTAGAARENKTMFDINKAAAVASAIVSGAQGVAHTYGAFPFPINIPFAAAHAALAAAQVGIIASKQFKGGGSNVAAAAPSVPAAAPAAATAPATGAVTGGYQQEVSVSASGSRFTRQDVLDLIEDLNDAVGDGARIRAT